MHSKHLFVKESSTGLLSSAVVFIVIWPIFYLTDTELCMHYKNIITIEICPKQIFMNVFLRIYNYKRHDIDLLLGGC